MRCNDRNIETLSLVQYTKILTNGRGCSPGKPLARRPGWGPPWRVFARDSQDAGSTSSRRRSAAACGRRPRLIGRRGGRAGWARRPFWRRARRIRVRPDLAIGGGQRGGGRLQGGTGVGSARRGTRSSRAPLMDIIQYFSQKN
jgi:hypothetical protein